MSEPSQETPKGPRRSGKRSKPGPAKEENNQSHISDVDSSAAPSATEHPQDGPSPNTQKKNRSKKKPQSAKKGGSEPTGDPSTKSESVRNPHSGNVPSRTKATPIKAQQAYAGPTFHQSPAPSALPIPSFYSNSVPNVSTAGPSDVANDSGAPKEVLSETINDRSPRKLDTEVQQERESTPLDFLFEAAKRASRTPRGESPDARSIGVSGHESPYNRSPAPRENDQVFPFELESGRNTPGGIAPSFATPYKDRMDALRSTSSSVGAISDLSDAEAKAKSDAMKKFLNLKPRATSVSPDMPDPNNPFNARAPQTRTLHQPIPQHRHRSGPSTPFSGLPNNMAPLQYFPNTQPPPGSGQYYPPPMQRPASSHLRHMYHPSVESSPVELPSDSANFPLISTARKQSVEQEMPRFQHDHVNYGQAPLQQGSNHKSKPSAQELENQLRSILKLDGIASRG